jgi:chromosome partitioning protein
MPIVSVTQLKGGVGKSTITANLAGEFILAHRTVMLFDLDPQKSLTRWAQRGHGLLRSKVQVMEVEAGQDRLKMFSAAVYAALEQVDIVLLDSPPGFQAPALAAAFVADIALVPVTPSPLDLMSAKEARDLLRHTHQLRAGRKPIIAFVPSKLTRTTWSRNLAEHLQAYGERVLPGITQRAALVDSILEGLTLREYEQRNSGVEDFRLLAAAVLQTMGGEQHVTREIEAR